MISNIKKMSATEIIKWFIAYGEDYTRNKRSCSKYEDDELFLTNVTRTIRKSISGRDFLQDIHDGDIKDLPLIKRAAYFDALNSSRRLSYVKDISSAILKLMDRLMINEADIDHLAGIPELEGRYVCAGDGHSTEHAVHDALINGKYSCMTVIYGQNLRTGLLDPIEMVIDPNSSKPNEIRFLKKSLPTYGSDRNMKKPILVYGRAVIDNTFWTITDQPWSIVTRLKKSIKPTFKNSVDYDVTDPINEGVTGYYIIGLNNAGTMYQIDYTDPETGESYSFLTNDETLRPGTVAYLYRIRWRIEKVFDVLKNKLHEKKAWAKSENSKEMQAHITAFTYNFIIFVEQFIKDECDTEIKVETKREKALNVREILAKKNNRSVPKCEYNFKHMFQVTQQFVRCVRNWFSVRTRLEEHLNLFIERLTSYI